MSKLKLLIAIFFLLATQGASAQAGKQSKQIFYIVRHAEKDTGNNPALSVNGQYRAGDLYKKLKRKNIDLIFVSQYRRTGMTADSLRIYQRIDTVHYKADATGDDLFNTLNKRIGSARNILIVGHSNTVPAIVRRAGASDYVEKELGDDEYDKLFIVTRKKNKTYLKIEKYGKASPVKTGDQKMNILQ
jgi:2,3-bisphosphoglycerate-dependent phosphoglycerate mutase